MSLDVPAALLERAERGAAGDDLDADFVACVRDSLPYAWAVVSAAVEKLDESGYADHNVPPPSEAARGQLLRAMASDAIRGGLERHFGVKLAFQNCEKVGAFRPSAVDSEVYRAFISARGQLLNQSPELRHC